MVLPESRPAYMTSKKELAIALKKINKPKLLVDVKIRREVFRATQILNVKSAIAEYYNSNRVYYDLTLKFSTWQQLYKCHIIRCFLTSAKLRTEIQRRISARVAGQFLPYCA